MAQRPGVPAHLNLKAKPEVSFEFFPPNSEAMERTLWSSIASLGLFAPRFVSVTYGAGGSTRERTHATVTRILEETSLTPAAHLTCVDDTIESIQRIAADYHAAGVRHIVALRGDPPDGREFSRHSHGFGSAAELVTGLRQVADFEISVAAHPETHPRATTPEADLDNLKRKIDAGASRAITQYFFDADIYLRFRDRAAAAGITVPIVPGILPVTNFAQVCRFSAACGATVPAWLAELFNGLDDEPETRQLVAASVAVNLVQRLSAHGVEEFHFYTLNRSNLTAAICRMLGLFPCSAPAVRSEQTSEIGNRI